MSASSVESAESGPSGPALPFPVVGIGASAGGLEALQDIFSHLRDGSKLAFFVVQHLSPDFKSVMVQILQRHTKLNVLHAENGLSITQGHVYLLPPRKDVKLDGRRILLEDRPSGGGLHLPIDLFLESLASTQKEQAVAVILSGTGTDGTRGVLAVRRSGGLVMVQDPNTAKFDGMPRSAIATGASDYVLSPFMIAEQLKDLGDAPRHPVPTAESEPLRRIFELVGRETRVDLSFYKEGTLMRRIHRRMQIVNQSSLSEYADQVASDESELQALCVDLLIGVTQFFRDPPAWEWLQEHVLKGFAERGGEFRFWVAGCSTGQEAYTLAIAMEECIAEVDSTARPHFRVFATDANPIAIRVAMAGEYTDQDMVGIPTELREKYFEVVGDLWRVRRGLRDRLTFAVHNLMTDPPFTRLDLVTCRNLLIYLRPEAQRPVLARLHFGLREGGALFLGPSETVGELKPYFQALDLKWKVFRAGGNQGDLKHLFGAGGPSLPMGRPAATRRPAAPADNHLKAVLDHFVPPGVAVDGGFDVVHIFGNITPFIQLPEGRANLNLMSLLPPAVSVFLSSSARRVRGTQEPHVIPNVELNDRNVDLRVLPTKTTPRGDDIGFLVFFESLPETEADNSGLVCRWSSPRSRRSGSVSSRTSSR